MNFIISIISNLIIGTADEGSQNDNVHPIIKNILKAIIILFYILIFSVFLLISFFTFKYDIILGIIFLLSTVFLGLALFYRIKKRKLLSQLMSGICLLFLSFFLIYIYYIDNLINEIAKQERFRYYIGVPIWIIICTAICIFNFIKFFKSKK